MTHKSQTTNHKPQTTNHKPMIIKIDNCRLNHEVRALDESEAKSLLDSIPNYQRKCSKRNLGGLRHNLSKGDWIYTGAPIRISDEGHLMDGQHRIGAMVAEGIFPPVLIITGFNASSTYPFLDCGVKRSSADYFTSQGIKNAAVMASAAKYLLAFEQGNFRQSYTPSNTDLEEAYRANADGFEVALQQIRPDAAFLSGQGAFVALFHVASKSIGVAAVIESFKQACDGTGANPASSIYRTFRVDNNRASRRLNNIERVRLLVRAMELKGRGSKSVKSVSCPDGYKFPFATA